jgi:hypothetical protein
MLRIKRWNVAAQHNLPVLRKIRRNHSITLKALLRPAIYRNRMNTWFLAAGMLDAARFINAASSDGGLPSMSASWRDGDVHDELAHYIRLNYRKEMLHFRVEFKNVAGALDDYEIKKALYFVIMRLPKSRIGNVSPFWLLRKAVNQVLIESKRTQRKNPVPA